VRVRGRRERVGKFERMEMRILSHLLVYANKPGGENKGHTSLGNASMVMDVTTILSSIFFKLRDQRTTKTKSHRREAIPEDDQIYNSTQDSDSANE
jgi:hypothetical protein